jgi:hypothetical protein
MTTGVNDQQLDLLFIQKKLIVEDAKIKGGLEVYISTEQAL